MGRLFGIQALIWAAGSLLGPLLGGIFVELGMWRAIFWCFALQAALLWLLAAMLPRTTPPHHTLGRIPAMRVLVLTTATLMIAQAGVMGGVGAALALGSVGIALLYLAARLDRRAGDRLLPAGLLDIRQPLGAGLLTVFALSVATTGFWAYGPLLLATLFGTHRWSPAISWPARRWPGAPLPWRSPRCPRPRAGCSFVSAPPSLPPERLA